MTRLLIIEDNPELVANLYAFFEPLGYVLDDARDGASGLRRATQHDYDAILLDLMLPRLDGMGLLERIKEDPTLARIPVVVLTQSGADADIRRAYDSFANCYVRKPLDLDQFIGVMQSIGHFWLSVVTLPLGADARLRPSRHNARHDRPRPGRGTPAPARPRGPGGHRPPRRPGALRGGRGSRAARRRDRVNRSGGSL